jgi:hypothetical protein
MNLKPKNWFITQKIIFILFVSIYTTMSLTPWYYNVGIKQEENQGIISLAISNINEITVSEDIPKEFQKKYLNNGRLSSMDMFIILGYLFSLSYVFGAFLTSLKNSIIVNIPLILLLLIKTLAIMKISDIYKTSIRNVIIWWVCLIIYYIVFYVHNALIVTDIDIA